MMCSWESSTFLGTYRLHLQGRGVGQARKKKQEEPVNRTVSELCIQMTELFLITADRTSNSIRIVCSNLNLSVGDI
jgi:hypothetical protein